MCDYWSQKNEAWKKGEAAHLPTRAFKKCQAVIQANENREIYSLGWLPIPGLTRGLLSHFLFLFFESANGRSAKIVNFLSISFCHNPNVRWALLWDFPVSAFNFLSLTTLVWPWLDKLPQLRFNFPQGEALLQVGSQVWWWVSFITQYVLLPHIESCRQHLHKVFFLVLT